MVANALRRIKQQQHDIGVGDRHAALEDRDFSIASKTLLATKPAVSISSNWRPSRSKGTCIASAWCPGVESDQAFSPRQR